MRNAISCSLNSNKEDLEQLLSYYDDYFWVAPPLGPREQLPRRTALVILTVGRVFVGARHYLALFDYDDNRIGECGNFVTRQARHVMRGNEPSCLWVFDASIHR